MAVDADIDELSSDEGREKIIKKVMNSQIPAIDDHLATPSLRAGQAIDPQRITINRSVKLTKTLVILGVPAFFMSWQVQQKKI